MPFGLCNTPATFECMMDWLLKGHQWTIWLRYLDGVIIFSDSFSSLLDCLTLALDVFHRAGLQPKMSKYTFASRSIKVLGHLVDHNVVRPDPDKMLAVFNFSTPTNSKHVQSFLRLCSYF